MSDPLLLGISVFGFFGWCMYLRERNRSRDYATDISQVIHDFSESKDSLRRSLKWDEIQKRVKKSNEKSN